MAINNNAARTKAVYARVSSTEHRRQAILEYTDMKIPEETLTHACNADCPRFYQGICPYRLSEKGSCPRVRDFMQSSGDAEREGGCTSTVDSWDSLQGLS